MVLLHGFPETNYAWRHQIPALVSRYRVIAPDLRPARFRAKPSSATCKRIDGQVPCAVSMSDYRANREGNAQDQVDAHVKIGCPVLSLWGADFEAVGKMFDMPAVWAEMADDVRTEAIAECGHLPHEEQPERVNGLALDFLHGWEG